MPAHVVGEDRPDPIAIVTSPGRVEPANQVAICMLALTHALTVRARDDVLLYQRRAMPYWSNIESADTIVARSHTACATRSRSNASVRGATTLDRDWTPRALYDDFLSGVPRPATAPLLS